MASKQAVKRHNFSLFNFLITCLIYITCVISCALLAYFIIITPPIAISIAPFIAKSAAHYTALVLGGVIGIALGRMANGLYFLYSMGSSPNKAGAYSPLNQEWYLSAYAAYTNPYQANSSPAVASAKVQDLYCYQGKLEGISVNDNYWYDSDDMEHLLNATVYRLGGYAPGCHYLLKPTARVPNTWYAVTGPAAMRAKEGGEQQFTPFNRLDKYILRRFTEGLGYPSFLLRKQIYNKAPHLIQYIASYSVNHVRYIDNQMSKNARFDRNFWARFSSLNYGFFVAVLDQVNQTYQRTYRQVIPTLEFKERLAVILKYGLNHASRNESLAQSVEYWGGNTTTFKVFMEQFGEYFQLLEKLVGKSSDEPAVIVGSYWKNYHDAITPSELIAAFPDKSDYLFYNIITHDILKLMDSEFYQQTNLDPKAYYVWAIHIFRNLCEMGMAEENFFNSWQRQIIAKKASGDDVQDVIDELLEPVLEKDNNRGFIFIPLNSGSHWVRLKFSFTNTDKQLEISGEYIDPFGGEVETDYLKQVLAHVQWRCIQFQMTSFLVKVSQVNSLKVDLLNVMLLEFHDTKDKIDVNHPGYPLYEFIQAQCGCKAQAFDEKRLKDSISYYFQQTAIQLDIIGLFFNFLQSIKPATMIDCPREHPRYQSSTDGTSCGVITIQGIIDDITGEKTLVAVLPKGAADLRRQQLLAYRNYCQANPLQLKQFEEFMKNRGFGVKAFGINPEFQVAEKSSLLPTNVIDQPNIPPEARQLPDVFQDSGSLSDTPVTHVPSSRPGITVS